MPWIESLVADKQRLIADPDLTLEQKVVGLLLCVAQGKKSEIDRRIQGPVLSFLQLNLLHALSKAPGGNLSVGELRRTMVDDSPNVSRTLNKLVELGLVRKDRSREDQRSVHVSITEAGERAHEEGDARLLDMSTGLEEPELKQLFDLLVKL